MDIRFDLAEVAAKPIYAAAAVIAIANRRTDEFLSNDRIAEAERAGGLAVLQALAAFPLPQKARHAGPALSSRPPLMLTPPCSHNSCSDYSPLSLHIRCCHAGSSGMSTVVFQTPD